MAMVSMSHAGALACALAMSCSAPAATRSATFQVTATVEASCLMHTPSAVASSPRSIDDRIRVTCSPRVPHAVTIEPAIAAVQAGRLPGRATVVLITY